MANTTNQAVLAGTRTAKPTGPVQCLGMTFETDAARLAFFLEKLREKLRDPQFRKIEGFPIGSDEAILRLSDPPYYTACPNPFLDAFVAHNSRPYDPSAAYSREPLAVDVNEGKTGAVYAAHGYHTKVPYRAILPALLHYTQPGDVVLDGFCGSGMTGLACQMSAEPEAEFKHALETEWRRTGHAPPQWGLRHAVLVDLSPSAVFVAANYNFPFDVASFGEEARLILERLELELGWMYETQHGERGAVGRINYTVWAEIFACPECSGDVNFVTAGLDSKTKRVKKEFPCPTCGSTLTKDRLERRLVTLADPATGQPWKRIRLEPVLINYRSGSKSYEKDLDDHDREVLDRISRLPYPADVPTRAFPLAEMYHGSRLAPKGFTCVHHLFTARAAHVLAALWRAASSATSSRSALALMALAHHQLVNASVMNRYRPASSFGNAPLGGVYYVSSMIAEANVFQLVRGSLKRLLNLGASGWGQLTRLSDPVCLSTQSTTDLRAVPSESVDYIFTDPPFGENIPYADLNFMEEVWHGVLTSFASEAIIDDAKKKGLPEYQHLMQRCFEEYCRALKPGRWMTVVFHNSRNSVWNAIQEAMQAAGFVVADVRTMDKQQGSYRQVTSSAMKQDLVISAYKPNGGLEERFKLKGGSEEGAWDFARSHLRQLPVFVSREGEVEVIGERQANLLYDRMVAFHVLRGVMVPLSAAEFFSGLAARFPERDGMYFQPEQAAEYDKKRLAARGVRQLDLFVHDEASAIEWLRQQLSAKPQTLQDLTPQFLREIAGWEKYEKPLELLEILRQNFLRYEGTGDVPTQIHGYLSTNFKELRKVPKDNRELRAKAKDRWFVPDPGKSGDLEKLREKALLQEFWEYLPPGYVPLRPEVAEGYLPGLEPKSPTVAPGRKMKIVRLEAVRAGFKYCWQNRDYKTIIAVAQRIPEDVLQEDPKLLMWYDQALTRSGAA